MILVIRYVTILFLISFEIFAQNFIAREVVIKHYNEHSQKVIEQFLCCDTSKNFYGNYAWQISYLLYAELLMYEATKDVFYLNRFVTVANKLLSNRDDVVGFKDWKGSSGPGWSEIQHYNPYVGGVVNSDRGMRYLISDAIIIFPYLKFVKIVRTDTVFSLSSIAAEYLKKSEETVEAIFSEWWSPTKRTFVFPSDAPVWCDGVNVPINYLSQIGNNLVLLYLITNDMRYKMMATEIAESVKTCITVTEGKLYWPYWCGKGYYGWQKNETLSHNTPSYSGQKSVDDIGHAGITVEFIVHCYEANIVFEEFYVNALIQTFHTIIDRGSYLTYTLTGEGNVKERNAIIPSYKWMCLGKYDREIGKSFYSKYYRTAITYGGAGNIFLLASILCYCY